MELRHLRYFVAVAEEENVSRAALKLRVSQPGVSRQLRDLEDELGFALLTRTSQSVRLTASGKIFFREARDILARTAAAVARARAGLTPRADIHVGYIPTGTVEIIPRVLRVFRSRFPGVRVTLHDLTAEEMPPLLLRKKLDVALTLPPHKLPRELDLKLLARYEPCVVVGRTHPLAGARQVSLKQMAAEPVAALARHDFPDYHRHLRKMFATIGRKPRVGSEHDSGTSLMAAVAAGHEWTLLPSSVSGVAGRRLKLLRVRPALPPWSVVALWRKDAVTEEVGTFVDAALPSRAKSKRKAPQDPQSSGIGPVDERPSRRQR
ncbi:MAG: LysR family transcriptional regulator [Gluconacetobacter diazotrophicus]|nr:LysR family transcriptional regulator [Gluconacetobacter diazotrophicus]